MPAYAPVSYAPQTAATPARLASVSSPAGIAGTQSFSGELPGIGGTDLSGELAGIDGIAFSGEQAGIAGTDILSLEGVFFAAGDFASSALKASVRWGLGGGGGAPTAETAATCGSSAGTGVLTASSTSVGGSSMVKN